MDSYYYYLKNCTFNVPFFVCTLKVQFFRKKGKTLTVNFLWGCKPPEEQRDKKNETFSAFECNGRYLDVTDVALTNPLIQFLICLLEMGALSFVTQALPSMQYSSEEFILTKQINNSTHNTFHQQSIHM